MSVPRKRLDELVVAHQLEDTLVDVYVEGRFDEDVVRWFLQEVGLHGVQVHTIDTIEINEQRPVSMGNRDRIIALAQNLEDRVLVGKVSCICDRDFETWLPALKPLPSALLLTDYPSMDCYVVDAAILDKFLSIVVVGKRYGATQVLEQIGPVLETCFLLRLAHAVLGWGLSWIRPDRCCKVSNAAALAFDEMEFCKRLLQKNGHFADREILLAKVDELRGTLDRDLRRKTHGHDFAHLLAWYLKKLGYTGVPSDVIRSLFGCATHEQLRSEQLFEELAQRSARVYRH